MLVAFKTISLNRLRVIHPSNSMPHGEELSFKYLLIYNIILFLFNKGNNFHHNSKHEELTALKLILKFLVLSTDFKVVLNFIILELLGISCE